MNPDQIPLRDLHLPEAIGWWPLAPGWWLLIGLLVTGLVLIARALYRQHRHNRARRHALRELVRSKKVYDTDGNLVALGARLSELLRRSMLAYSPRHEMAGLTGHAWLLWLDQGLEDRPFSEGPGRPLKDLPYRKAAPAPADLDVDGLIDVVQRRLQAPLPGTASW